MYGRICHIVAQAAGGQTIDVSQLRCRFQIKQHNLMGPDKAIIKITNQNPVIARKFVTPNAEFTTISIYTGWEDEGGTVAMIFSGHIVQAFYGRENPTDTLTTIVATAGHQAHNYATLSTTLPAGSTQMDQLNAAAKAMGKYGITLGYVDPSLNLGATKYPRAMPLWGMARNVLHNISRSHDAQVSYKNGQIQVLGKNSALPGGAVVLNSKTGMVGMPTQEIGGIMVRSLINTKIRCGGQIKIDQKDIQQLVQQTGAEGDLTRRRSIRPR